MTTTDAICPVYGKLMLRKQALTLAANQLGFVDPYWLGTRGGDHGARCRATGRMAVVDLVIDRAALCAGCWSERSFSR